MCGGGTRTEAKSDISARGGSHPGLSVFASFLYHGYMREARESDHCSID